MGYTDKHTNALATITRKGAAVTFTHIERTGYDPETDLATNTTTTVSGYAVQTTVDPRRYAQLGLVESEAPALLFSASTFGDVPQVGSTVSWGGVTYTVRSVATIAPDGNAIVSSIIVEE